jgi:long-chain acyl-CoA synthetase
MVLDERGLVVRAAPRPIPNGPRDVSSLLAAARKARPDHEALVGRHRRFTFAEIDDAADGAAAALDALGVQPGDRVAASLPNQPELILAFLGTMRLGAIWVGINTALAPTEKLHMLADCDAMLLLTTAEIATSVEPFRCVTVDLAGERGTWVDAVAGVVRDGPRSPRAVIDPHAPAAIAYTSGTTGFPKGAVHSQHNMLWPGADARDNDPGPPDERHGVLLPLTLLNLMILGPLFAWSKGTTCVCVDRTDPIGLSEWIAGSRITRMTFAPAIVHDLLRHPDVAVTDLVSLRRPECGGSSTPNALRQLFLERFGAPVLTGYGLTEAPTAVAREMPGDALLAGCSGVAFAPCEVVVVDESGAPVAANTMGEICVRARTDGPWKGVYTPFLGYWNRPLATEHALRAEMLHTGDIGELDDAGRLFVKDRMNDVVIRGGANVYPAEVERVLHEHPGVAACAVLGVPDERLGERVVAVVQPTAGTMLDPAELAAYCRELLARYKVPERWAFVDSFTRTPMGKIPKGPLRDLFT